jgi:hypothetical protein
MYDYLHTIYNISNIPKESRYTIDKSRITYKADPKERVSRIELGWGGQQIFLPTT